MLRLKLIHVCKKGPRNVCMGYQLHTYLAFFDIGESFLIAKNDNWYRLMELPILVNNLPIPEMIIDFGKSFWFTDLCNRVTYIDNAIYQYLAMPYKYPFYSPSVCACLYECVYKCVLFEVCFVTGKRKQNVWDECRCSDLHGGTNHPRGGMPPRQSSQCHYSDVIMGAMASQITSLTIVYSTVY